MRSQLVGPALALVRAAGADAAALIDRFELPRTAESDVEVVLPMPTLHAFLDAAAEAARDPLLGVHLAARMPRGAYGVVEYASRSAPTLREAIARLVRYIGVLNELVTVTAEERDGLGVVEQRVASEPRAVGRHGNEFFVVMLLGHARALTGRPIAPVKAWFAHAQPETAALAGLLEALGTTHVRFDAQCNGAALAPELLDLPLVTSDPPLLSLLDRAAEQSLAGRPGQSQLLSLVRRRVRESLAESPQTLETCADALRMSARTLQRRLADEGSTFQKVLDDVRHELAVELVRDPRHALGEVAFLLGYAELSPFLRAFKRWTGKTPADFRVKLSP